MSTIHIVGAGLSGLAAATSLAERGHNVVLYEAAGQAGGRCRSFHDTTLDRLIDNGNHLVLGGNAAVFQYLDRFDARARMTGGDPIAYPFVDLRTGERWTLRPNAGPLPWWMLSPRRRVPGTRLKDYLAPLKLLRAGPDDTVADRLDIHDVLFERLWGPLAIAALNIDPAQGSARLLGAVMAQTFLRGGAACRPFVAAEGGLSAAFVDPALAYLERRGGRIRFHTRLRRIELSVDRATLLEFAETTIPLAPTDAVVLALPPAALATLLPGQPVPQGSTAILNAHYRLGRQASLPGGAPLFGVIGGTAEWLFVRDDVVSVTVSAADRLIDQPAESLAALLWRDVAAALELDGNRDAMTGGSDLPPWRIVKEKRATFAQTPAGSALRPEPATPWRNLFRAGDWTATGLPATIEGAIRSGNRAAAAVLEASAAGVLAARLTGAHGKALGLSQRP